MAVNAWALTTRQRLQDFMGLTSPTATQQSVLDRLIDSVTDFIENYCQRRFKLTTYTQEVYNGTGSPYLLLKQFPVDKTTAVTLGQRTSSINEDSWEDFDSEAFYIHYDEGMLELISGLVFRKYPQAYRVTYKAGYDIDTAAKTLELAGLGDLEYVVWKLCTTAYNTKSGGGNVISESLGDYSVTFSKEIYENNEIKAVLDKYVRLNEL